MAGADGSVLGAPAPAPAPVTTGSPVPQSRWDRYLLPSYCYAAASTACPYLDLARSQGIQHGIEGGKVMLEGAELGEVLGGGGGDMRCRSLSIRQSINTQDR